MEQYTLVSRRASAIVIDAYSTSFGIASRLFKREIRSGVSDIYALVRIADEIVDTYEGSNPASLLDELEEDVHRAIKTGYSTNIIVHAFAATSRESDINNDHIKAFFRSMRQDLNPKPRYNKVQYEQYIFGSAEVIGLMCLKLFVDDKKLYNDLAPGAKALGAAFQKVNFLRDLADDYNRLHRFYFPNTTYDGFNDISRDEIVSDIKQDLLIARVACLKLPHSSQYAVGLALIYFDLLVKQLQKTPASVIKKQRVRVGNFRKLRLYLVMYLRQLSGVSAI